MHKRTKLLLAGLPLLIASSSYANEQDVAELDAKVNEKVQQIEQTGLLPTSTEIEVIMGDIIDNEVQNGNLTIEQAIEKYQLTPTLERYIKIKDAGRTSFGPGQVKFPPDPPSW